MFTITDQDKREEAEAIQKLLIGVSVVLFMPQFIIPFGAPSLLPVAAFAFLASMAHAVFLLTRYPTTREIPWQSWVMYGLSIIPSGFALSYGLRMAGPHMFAVAAMIILLLLSVTFGWRRNRRLLVLQWVFIGAGLVIVPINFAIRDYSALYKTIQAGNIDHVRFLLALGADVGGDNSVLLHATLGGIEKPANIEMMDFLLDQGADPNAADSQRVFDERTSTTPLLAAVVSADRLGEDGQLAMLRLLFERGADPNRDSSDALFRAVRFGSLPVTDLLIQNGGNVHARNEYGWSLLFEPSTRKLAQYLVERGVQLDVRDERGRTALFEVAQNADVDVVAYLVEQGMDVNARANDGTTPLLSAADANGGRSENIQYLLAHGADPSARNNQGRTAIDFARERNNPDIAALLEAAMAR